MEKLLADLLQTSPIGIAVLDSELRYVHINHQLANSNGLSPKSISAARRATSAEVGPGLEAIMHKVMASGVAECNFEASAEIPPGRAASPTGMPATTRALTSRAACGIIAMVEDVSLKKQAELAIRASSERIRKVLDALFTFVGVLGIDGTLLEANRAPLEQAGLELPEVQGKLFWECYWWNHDPPFSRRCNRPSRAASGQTVRYDVVVRMKNDSRMTIDFMLQALAGRRWPHQQPDCLRHRYHRAQAKRTGLADQRNLFPRSGGIHPGRLMMVDQHGVIRLINTRMEQLFGYSRRELVGEKLSSLLPEGFRSQHGSYVTRLLHRPSARHGQSQALVCPAARRLAVSL
jgi:PAS domain-containing protein